MTTENPAGNGTAKKAPPVARINDGAVTAKVWRNLSQDGNVYYSTTLSRVYTDPKTNQPAETYSFGQNDLMKVEKVSAEAYRTIQWNREQDRAKAREVEQQVPQHPSPSMADQRDAAMNAAANNRNGYAQNETAHTQTGPSQDAPEPGRH